MEVYFDNAATTRVAPEVVRLMDKVMEEDYGNPSSKHMMGLRAENYVTDYSPLSGMKHLKELEMAENQFPQAVDISPP